jgi:hypothetical protein
MGQSMAGLPDGILTYMQKSSLMYFLKDLEWKMFVYFMVIFKYFMAILYILRPFGIFCGPLVYKYFQFWYVVPRKKNWQPRLMDRF